MTRASRCAALAAAAALVMAMDATATVSPSSSVEPGDPVGLLAEDRARAEAELRRLESRTRWPEDDRVFDEAARAAWAFVDDHYVPATGFVVPVQEYSIATIWDIASMIAAFYSAHGLGLVDDGVYRTRLTRLLSTLERVRLYDGAVLSKAYDTRSAAMIGRRGAARPGLGYSPTDLGRLLIWLRIAAADPRFHPAVERVVQRNDFSRLVRYGFLWGEDFDEAGDPARYPEGRIGYEQYAAQGFQLWGQDVGAARSTDRNALPLSIMGEPLVADLRRWDRLTTEPFLLMGLEVGWDGRTARLVRALVAAQRARFERTGRLTLTGEDAISQPPDYFYYYCVYAHGMQFAVDVQDRARVAESPRWVSTKAAFALHALQPSGYSARALEAVAAARRDRGWSSGVFESSGRSTGTPNINTAAVILEAALARRAGEPLLAHARRAAAGTR